MSGSSGGGYSYGDTKEIACDQLMFSTNISSPQAPAIFTVNVSDVLQIGIHPLNGVQVVAVLKNGVIVGGLVGGKVDRLRSCIISGSQYKATVLTAKGPQVQVEVEHV